MLFALGDGWDTGSRGSGMGPGPHLRARRRDGALDARIAAGKLSPGHLFRFAVSGHVSGVNALPSWGRARRGFSAWPALTRSVSTAVRVADDLIRLALGRERETLRRRGPIPWWLSAYSARAWLHRCGRAVALGIVLASAERVVPVEVRVERVQDHLADGREELLDGARWR